MILIFVIWLLSPAAARPLANPDEGRYAAIPQAMATSGDWVTPRLNSVKYFEKPPLMYWVEAAVIKFVSADERALRAPVALFAFAGCLIAYFGTRVHFGRAAARITAFVLATSLFYWAMAGLLILDMVVAVLMSATLFCFLAGVVEANGPRRRAWFYGLYASAALATLTKGLIGFLVPGAVMFLWLLLYRQWRQLRPLYLPSGTLLFLAIAAPWHVLVAWRNTEWAWFYFVHEHWLRFVSTTHGHAQPWWYYLPILGLGLFPWFGFLPAAVRDALPRRTQNPTDPSIAGFFVLWAGFILVLFSAAGSKLAPYVLPAFPPLAVLLGRWMTNAGRGARKTWQCGLGVAVGLTVLLAIAFAALAIRPKLIGIVPLAGLRPWFGAAAALLLVGAVWIWRSTRRQDYQRSILVTGGAAVLFYVVLANGIAPRVDFAGTKEFVGIIREQGGLDDPVFHYRGIYQDFLFYAGREVALVDARTELRLDLDAVARTSGRFIDGTEFRRRWQCPDRTWVILRRTRLSALRAAGICHFHVCAETTKMLLLCNQAVVSHDPARSN